MSFNGSVPGIDFGGLGTGIPPVKSMSLKWVVRKIAIYPMDSEAVGSLGKTMPSSLRVTL